MRRKTAQTLPHPALSVQQDLGLEVPGSCRNRFEGLLNAFERIVSSGEGRGPEPAMGQKRQRVMHVLPHSGNRAFEAVFLEYSPEYLDRNGLAWRGNPEESHMTALADQVEGLAIELRAADAFDDEICAASARHLQHLAPERRRLRYSSIRARLNRHAAALARQIRNNDRGHADKAHHLDMQVADGARSQNHSRPTEGRTGLARRPDDAGDRFDEGKNGFRNPIRHR